MSGETLGCAAIYASSTFARAGPVGIVQVRLTRVPIKSHASCASSAPEVRAAGSNSVITSASATEAVKIRALT